MVVGKSTLAKYVVQNPIMNTNSKVLIAPYSGYIGQEAKALWDVGKYFDWATIIGKNHWRAPENVNSIYDRSILTFMTDLIKLKLPDEKILEAIKTWEPLPDILFFCEISPEIALSRSVKRGEENDEFDELKSLLEYYELYNKAIEFVEKNNITKVVRVDASRTIEEIINEIEEKLNKFFMKGK